ncbi:MAG: hypothetical protein V2A58_17135 [Planctomycetota bacterium]
MPRRKVAEAGCDVVLVVSKVRAYVRSKGCMTSKEGLVALNAKVHRLLDESIMRAKANKRLTVKPQDV